MDAQGSINSPAEMVEIAIDGMTAKATQPPARSFLLALTAGAFIGIGFTFYLVSQMGASAMPLGMAKVVGGFLFATGLMLCILTGAELFTSSTMTLTAKATGRITWGELFKNWGIVYVGNFIGSLTLVALMWLGGVWKSNGGLFGSVLLKTADTKLTHDFTEAFFLGILCNLLVCLAVWCSYAGKTVVDKIAAILLPIAMFVATGFEHSVANMFLMPFAMLVKDAAPSSFWTAAQLAPDSLTHLTWFNVFVNNLLPVTLGNIVGGGVMIGLFYVFTYHVAGRPKDAASGAK